MQFFKRRVSGFLGPVPPAPADVASSLRSLRVFMASLGLLAIVAFIAFATYRHHQMYAEAEVRLARSLSIAHEHALRVLDTNDTLVRHVVDLTEGEEDARLRARSGPLHARLVELAANKPQVQSIWVQGADGRPIASSRFAQPPATMDVSGRPYFTWHQGHRGTFVSDVMKQEDSGQRFFNISRGRYTPTGDFTGLVSVGLFAGYFTRFHEELAANEPGLAITLFREDGVVYSRWPELPDAPDRMSPRGEVLSRVLKGETSGVVRSVSSLDNQRRVILFRKLGDYPVYIGVGRELRAIDREWMWELATIAGFAVLPVLGIVYAAYLALKRTREALEAARQLQQESSARRQAEEALVQSQKLEALGRLTGGVAHDFNNALMVISGNLHLLKLTQPGLPSRYADAIARAVESATKLTRQLLAFSRRQALSPETIRLQDYLPALRDLLGPTLGSKVQLLIEVAPDTHPIHVDPADLELGLINLAVNARDAMPNGGQFRLLARDTGAADGRRLVAIEAADTGEGMDPATLAKAFDPFFTTKPIGKGTGLGLSQVHALCKRAAGDVQLESVKGSGTTVRLLFPASQAPVAEGPQGDESRARFDRRVLLVEDNPEVAAVVLPALQALGCGVKHLDSADAAAEWLDAHAGKVDLLLTDVVMPGERDGISLVAHAQARHPSLRIVIMTGYAEQIEAVSGLGFQVLAKPFSPRSLAEALEKAFG